MYATTTSRHHRSSSATAVFGAGKAGRVLAWNRHSGRRLWATAVGTHDRDLGPLPREKVKVCPGLWGGVLTPMAYADGRLFVPVVEQCSLESAVDPAELPDLRRGRGELVAIDAHTGRKTWVRRFASPATGCATVAGDVVFAPTLDGHVYALDTRNGTLLWSSMEPAGINSCPSASGGLLRRRSRGTAPGRSNPDPDCVRPAGRRRLESRDGGGLHHQARGGGAHDRGARSPTSRPSCTASGTGSSS